jgi:hypothetical protein
LLGFDSDLHVITFSKPPHPDNDPVEGAATHRASPGSPGPVHSRCCSLPLAKEVLSGAVRVGELSVRNPHGGIYPDTQKLHEKNDVYVDILFGKCFDTFQLASNLSYILRFYLSFYLSNMMASERLFSLLVELCVLIYSVITSPFLFVANAPMFVHKSAPAHHQWRPQGVPDMAWFKAVCEVLAS